jgi:hypothetical protein
MTASESQSGIALPVSGAVTVDDVADAGAGAGCEGATCGAVSEAGVWDDDGGLVGSEARVATGDGSRAVDVRVVSAEVRVCRVCDPVPGTGRPEPGLSVAALSVFRVSVARGRDARRGAGVSPGRTIFGASGIGIVVVVC